MSFELLRSESLFKGRVFAIRRDWVKTPDGSETKFDILEHQGSVVIVPVDAHGNILFVRQYRHATGGELLELPAGSLEGGEAPSACASREVREETGYAAGSMEELGKFYLAPGYSTELMTAFFATNLTYDPLAADADEFLTLERLPIEGALRGAFLGEIPDAKSMAALLLAKSRLEDFRQR